MRSLPPWNDKVGPTATQLRRRALSQMNGSVAKAADLIEAGRPLAGDDVTDRAKRFLYDQEEERGEEGSQGA